MIGYIGRILAHNNTDSIPIYSIQTILILLAPALFAASIYMVLGRLIVALGAERLSPIRVKWLTKIFVCGDVIAFLGQATGKILHPISQNTDMLTTKQAEESCLPGQPAPSTPAK